MSRLYSAVFSAVAVTAQQDLFAIVAGTNKAIRLHAIHIGQSSDAGDAQDELLAWNIKRGATTVGSGGQSVTPVPINQGDAAFAGTARINDTTPASAGTIVTLHSDVFNLRAGLVWIPTPEMRPSVDGATRIVIGLASTPADSLTMSGTVYFEEV